MEELKEKVEALSKGEVAPSTLGLNPSALFYSYI